MQYTIFVHFFLYDNMKPPIYTFYEGNIVGVPVRFFSLPRNVALVAASISHFLTAAMKFLCSSSTKFV